MRTLYVREFKGHWKTASWKGQHVWPVDARKILWSLQSNSKRSVSALLALCHPYIIGIVLWCLALPFLLHLPILFLALTYTWKQEYTLLMKRIHVLIREEKINLWISHSQLSVEWHWAETTTTPDCHHMRFSHVVTVGEYDPYVSIKRVEYTTL